MTEIIVEVVIETCVDASRMLEAFLLVYSGFFATLNNVIGSEIGAHFLQTVIDKFFEFYNKSQEGLEESEEAVVGKQCSNLVIILSHLYNFQVISSKIIQDLLKIFLKNFSELDVELTLLALKYCGFQMRGEDPATVKEIILEVQTQAAQQPSQRPRVKFMVETINDIKNNKKRDGNDMESRYAPLKKYLKGLAKKKGLGYVEPLRVTLQDLLESKEKGRWWLVGSAWAGNSGAGQDIETPLAQAPQMDNKFLKLAKKMGMNTDIRKQIFLILVTSEDYAEAFERLLKLGLKEKQEREIVRVIIHCCGQEGTYNPYYAHLSQKLCSLRHGFKITFQYALWDFFKQIEESPAQKIKNTARLLAFLLVSEALGVVIFKAVDFHQLSSKAASFFQVVFTILLLQGTEMSLVTIFEKVNKTEDVRDGILFFLFHFVQKGQTLPADKQALVKKHYKLVKGALQPKFETKF